MADTQSALFTRSARNQQDWAEARKLGLTEDSLAARHPEVAAARDSLDNQAKLSAKVAMIGAGVATVLGATLPLLMFKQSANKWAKRAVTSVALGGGAGLAAGFGTAHAALKPLQKKAAEFDAVQTAALEQEIGAAVVQAHNPPAPLPVASLPKEFTASVAPRDASHTTQIVLETTQPSPAARGK